MSIKVMTWVWDHSPAVGTELLMLLAIADHASDNGRDAWPSIKTLARRTRLGERTVQRVLKRLADEGHLVIHVGGGRRSNHYEIPMTSDNSELSTPTSNRRPRQDDTPATSPGHPRCDDVAPPTQLRRGTPDTAMTPEPSSNGPRTLHPAPDATVEPRSPAGSDTDGGGGGFDTAAMEVLAGLGPDWPLTHGQRRRLTPMIATALDAGWRRHALIEHLAANPDGVKSPAAVLAARLHDLPRPFGASGGTERPDWCGNCDQTTRHRERDDGRVERCPACHPTRLAC
ncbi:MAG: hypothetical protein GEU97_18710 [Actinophytocola sp.]|nr:hypothetical protein [Actinophytocola sp.]